MLSVFKKKTTPPHTESPIQGTPSAGRVYITPQSSGLSADRWERAALASLGSLSAGFRAAGLRSLWF